MLRKKLESESESCTENADSGFLIIYEKPADSGSHAIPEKNTLAEYLIIFFSPELWVVSTANCNVTISGRKSLIGNNTRMTSTPSFWYYTWTKQKVLWETKCAWPMLNFLVLYLDKIKGLIREQYGMTCAPSSWYYTCACNTKGLIGNNTSMNGAPSPWYHTSTKLIW